MITAQLDHLRAIDAHCADLLEIGGASKDAEAGWKATRSTIDWLIHMHKHGEGWRNVGLVDDILAAFPLESLNS